MIAIVRLVESLNEKHEIEHQHLRQDLSAAMDMIRVLTDNMSVATDKIAALTVEVNALRLHGTYATANIAVLQQEFTDSAYGDLYIVDDELSLFLGKVQNNNMFRKIIIRDLVRRLGEYVVRSNLRTDNYVRMDITLATLFRRNVDELCFEGKLPDIGFTIHTKKLIEAIAYKPAASVDL